MDRLLMVADDFTGALDTGVQFAVFGARTCVMADPDADLAGVDGDVQVLVVDARSRHLAPQQAHDAVFGVVRRALDAGFTHIYKKTDSALRGNVGAELAAVLDAAGAQSIAFFPAFPKMGRVTRGGVHYTDGVPVAESVFGQDPFEPVRHSRLSDVIGEQTHRPVITHRVGDGGFSGAGIHVYDAQTDDDLRRGAQALRQTGQLRLLAGCAGFAAFLPQVLAMPLERRQAPRLRGKLLTVCGSVNPIAIRQLDEAERAGALRVRLTPEQKLTEGWAQSPEGRQTIGRWLCQIKQVPNAIVECGVDDRTSTDECAARLGLSLEQTRRRIADAMGGVLGQLLDMGLERDLLVTGGDTLLAFMERVGQKTLFPLGQPAIGVALSELRYGGKVYNLMSKSGGFGEQTLLCQLAARKE